MYSEMKTICCDECLQVIAMQSTNAASLWLELCGFQPKLPVLLLRENRILGYIDHLKLLENLRYISTADLPWSERNDEIRIRVEGYEKIALNDLTAHTFCINRQEHTAPWADMEAQG